MGSDSIISVCFRLFFSLVEVEAGVVDVGGVGIGGVCWDGCSLKLCISFVSCGSLVICSVDCGVFSDDCFASSFGDSGVLPDNLRDFDVVDFRFMIDNFIFNLQKKCILKNRESVAPIVEV